MSMRANRICSLDHTLGGLMWVLGYDHFLSAVQIHYLVKIVTVCTDSNTLLVLFRSVAISRVMKNVYSQRGTPYRFLLALMMREVVASNQNIT